VFDEQHGMSGQEKAAKKGLSHVNARCNLADGVPFYRCELEIRCYLIDSNGVDEPFVTAGESVVDCLLLVLLLERNSKWKECGFIVT
jgi:hypothetical protein